MTNGNGINDLTPREFGELIDKYYHTEFIAMLGTILGFRNLKPKDLDRVCLTIRVPIGENKLLVHCTVHERGDRE